MIYCLGKLDCCNFLINQVQEKFSNMKLNHLDLSEYQQQFQFHTSVMLLDKVIVFQRTYSIWIDI